MGWFPPTRLLAVKLPFKGEPHEDERVGKTLNADADGPVAHIRASRLLDLTLALYNFFFSVTNCL
jgi:hypothetical protein